MNKDTNFSVILQEYIVKEIFIMVQPVDDAL